MPVTMTAPAACGVMPDAPCLNAAPSTNCINTAATLKAVSVLSGNPPTSALTSLCCHQLFDVNTARLTMTPKMIAPDASAQDRDPAFEQERDPALAEFREALDTNGEWVDHPRYGETWVPYANEDRGWRPYSRGQWVYTDEHGWYWESDEPWGWVVYHYGRWLLDDRYGWMWVPGTEWGPAWVAWREGDEAIGWAPLPPKYTKGVLAKYAKLVSSAADGAVCG